VSSSGGKILVNPKQKLLFQLDEDGLKKSLISNQIRPQNSGVEITIKI
jgi:hypothetical protein